MYGRRRLHPIVALLGLFALAGCGGTDRPAVAIGPGDTSVPVPADYGLYAYDDGTLIRLDGDSQWERQTWGDRDNLSTRTEFVIFSRAVLTDQSALNQLVQLHRVAQLRNEVTASGTVATGGDRWVVPDMGSYALPLSFRPVAGRPDMVVADPLGELPPGLYALQLHEPGQTIDSRLGIRWADLERSSYVASNCVDKYPEGYRSCADSDAAQASGQPLSAAPQPPASQTAEPTPQGQPPGGQPMGSQPTNSQPMGGSTAGQVAVAPLGGTSEPAPAAPPPATLPVAPLGGSSEPAPVTAAAPMASPAPPAIPAPSPAAAAAPSTGSDIVVRNLVSSRTTVAGGPTLLIEGNVINQAATPRQLPQLYANILDAQGTVLQRVAIGGIPPTTLAPGDSYHFRSEVVDPPAAAVKVRVTPGA